VTNTLFEIAILRTKENVQFGRDVMLGGARGREDGSSRSRIDHGDAQVGDPVLGVGAMSAYPVETGEFGRGGVQADLQALDLAGPVIGASFGYRCGSVRLGRPRGRTRR
jgi:hypothetical protein